MTTTKTKMMMTRCGKAVLFSITVALPLPAQLCIGTTTVKVGDTLIVKSAIGGGLCVALLHPVPPDTIKPPIPSTGWAHEPIGMTVVSDARWGSPPHTTNDQAFGNGWNATNSTVNRITDVTAPIDSTALEWVYPVGFQAGASPGTIWRTISPGARTLYIGFWWKPSNPWQGHPSNVNKISFFDAGNTPIYLAMYGLGTYQLQFSTPAWLTPITNKPVVLGVWHLVEVVIDGSRVKWWMDNVAIGDSAFPFGPVTGFSFSPTWGGVGGVKTERDTYEVGRVRVSVR